MRESMVVALSFDVFFFFGESKKIIYVFHGRNVKDTIGKSSKAHFLGQCVKKRKCPLSFGHMNSSTDRIGFENQYQVGQTCVKQQMTLTTESAASLHCAIIIMR